MEFGLGDVLPLYAGGLGVLAGDFLKAASDLGVPVVGVGLLYQEGLFPAVVGR
jgi:starch phosphorylase